MNDVNRDAHFSLRSRWSNLVGSRWLVMRLWQVLVNEGIMPCIRKSCAMLGGGGALGFPSGATRSYHDRAVQYDMWRKHHVLSSSSLRQMRYQAERLVVPQVFTVVLLVGGIDEKGLRETIESLQGQTYPHWKLLVLGELSRCSPLSPMLEVYSRNDARIQFHLLSEAGRVSDYVLNRASGEFLCFISEDCYLSLDALFAVATQFNESPDLDFLYADEDTVQESGELRDPFFKPGWSPDLLIAMNYVGCFSVVRKTILRKIGGDWGQIEDVEWYHLVLQVTENTNKIVRIPKILCHRRTAYRATWVFPQYANARVQLQVKSLQMALDRRGERAEVLCNEAGRLKVAYQVQGQPLVSIIIPTKNRWDMLRQCIESIESVTGYPFYEIIVIENESSAHKAQRYLRLLSKKWDVYSFPGPFNFSSINNYGASMARGEFLLFLNDDTQIVSPSWLSVMVAQAQRVGVGAVGAKLLYPSGRIQHAGVVLGVRGAAGHAFRHLPGDQEHYNGLCSVPRNCSAVTAACMLVSAKVFVQVGGFEPSLRVEYNDVDLCLRLLQEGYRIVYTPDAQLVHHENASRKGGRHPADEAYFLSRWGERIRQGDPYYNPQLTCMKEDWSIRI